MHRFCTRLSLLVGQKSGAVSCLQLKPGAVSCVHRCQVRWQKTAINEESAASSDDENCVHQSNPSTSQLAEKYDRNSKTVVQESPFFFYKPGKFLCQLEPRKKRAKDGVKDDSGQPPLEKVTLLHTVDPKTFQWEAQHFSIRALPSLYLQLAKQRLTALVVVTSMAGYAMSPDPFSVGALAACTVGTALMSASANAFNQFLEQPYDSQMKRTQARVLVTRKLSSLHAFCFASAVGLGGFVALYTLVNPMTALLGLANVFLYAGVYTPMKRYHIGCTWAGAVVGAIPPLMGWAACSNSLGWGSLVLAGILYSWQFPHFNGLSWNLRPDYSRAGYRVMCVTNPGLCKRTSLRHSVALLALCSAAAPLSGLTTWTFAVDSVPLNLYLIYLSYKFYDEADSKSSRKLFRFTLVYLPALIILMLISKDSYFFIKDKKQASTSTGHELSTSDS